MGIIITKFLIVAAIVACGMYVCCVIYTETERELRDIMANRWSGRKRRQWSDSDTS